MPAADPSDLPLRVLIADPRPLWREALRATVERLEPTIVVEEIADQSKVVARVAAENGVGLLLISLDPRKDSDLRQLDLLARHAPHVPVVVVADLLDVDGVFAVLHRGARGYIPTTLDSRIMVEALRLVAAGGTYIPDLLVELLTSHTVSRVAVDRARSRIGMLLAELSPRQRQVLELLGRGKPNKLIAHELSISENTVKAHLRQIMKRLGVHNRTEAVLISLGRDPSSEE